MLGAGAALLVVSLPSLPALAFLVDVKPSSSDLATLWRVRRTFVEVADTKYLLSSTL